MNHEIMLLRAHHGVCLLRENGGSCAGAAPKSRDALAARLRQSPEIWVHLGSGADILCRHCPRWQQKEGCCENAEAMARLDRAWLAAAELCEGAELPWTQYRDRLRALLGDACKMKKIEESCNCSLIFK